MSVVKSDLIKELADNYPNFLRKDLTKLIDITISEMQNALKRGERVDMRGFGSFLVKQRAPRDARNPATSEIIKLDERFDPVFKVSKLLRSKVNKSLIRGF